MRQPRFAERLAHRGIDSADVQSKLAVGRDLGIGKTREALRVGRAGALGGMRQTRRRVRADNARQWTQSGDVARRTGIDGKRHQHG